MFCPNICSPTRARAGPRVPLSHTPSHSHSVHRRPSQRRRTPHVTHPHPATLTPNNRPTTAPSASNVVPTRTPPTLFQVPRKKTRIARVKSTLKQRRSDFRSWYERELLDLAVKHTSWVPDQSVEGVLYHVPAVPGKHSRDSLIQVLDDAVESLSSNASTRSERSGNSFPTSLAVGKRGNQQQLDLLDENVYDLEDYGWIREYAVLTPKPSSVQVNVVIEASPLPSPGLAPKEQEKENVLVDIELPLPDSTPAPPRTPAIEPAETPLITTAPASNPIKGPSPPVSPVADEDSYVTLFPSPLRISKKLPDRQAPNPLPPHSHVTSPRTATKDGKRILTRRRAESDLRQEGNPSCQVTPPTPVSTLAPSTHNEPDKQPQVVRRPTQFPRKPVPPPIETYQPFRPRPEKRQAPEFVPYRPTGKRGPILPTIPKVSRTSLFDEMNMELDNFLGAPSRQTSTESLRQESDMTQPDEPTDDIDFSAFPTPPLHRLRVPNLPYLPYSQSLSPNDCVEPACPIYQPYIPPRSTSLTPQSQPINPTPVPIPESESTEVSDPFRARLREATREALISIPLGRSGSVSSEDFGWKRWVDKEYEDPAVGYSKRQREKLRLEKKRKAEQVLVEFDLE